MENFQISSWEIALYFVDRGADLGHCFLVICRLIGEVEGLNDERVKMYLD